MRKILLLTIVMATLAVAAGAQTTYSSWSAAVQASRSRGLPIVAVFEQSGCPDCSRMNQALASGRTRQALRNTIRVRLQYHSNQSLADRFGISATPTLLVFAPGKTDDPIFREVGSMSVDQLVSLGRSLASYSAPAAQERRAEPTPAPAPEASREQSSARLEQPEPRQETRAERRAREAAAEEAAAMAARAAVYYYY